MLRSNRPSLVDVLGPGGITSEVRQPQIDMATIVAQAIAEGRQAIIEGGTGTGKSLGYLVPVIAGGMRAVVSTATKALQDQLVSKDMPFLRAAFRDRFGVEFTFACLKGASNYACNRRISDAAKTLPPAIVRWAADTKTGDVADAPIEDDRMREAIRVDMDDCEKKACPFYKDGSCFYRKARQSAESAEILIVNHALLSRAMTSPFLLDLSGFDAVIIDEGHQFEEIVRDAFGGSFLPGKIRAFLHNVEKTLVPEQGKLGTAEQIEADNASAASWAIVRDKFRMASLEMIKPWMAKTEDEIKYKTKETDSLIPLEFVRATGKTAQEALAELAAWVRSRLKEDRPDHKRLNRQLEGIAEFFSAIASQDVIAVARRKLVDGEKFAQVRLETYPLHVGPRLADTLYAIAPVIITSATIATGGAPGEEFKAARAALGLNADALEMVLTSPFDYPNQSLLYIPRGVPDPKHVDYKEAINNQIEMLLNLSGGGAFVLFTSTKAMKDAFFALRTRLRFPLKLQDQTPKGQLISWFQGTPNSVLFATASFWEGVSIEGSALRLIVIDKIPFPPPSDPIYRAKGSAIIAKGGREFDDLSVPSAITKLKQGFGRLIRTQTDHGMVAILDSRIHGKGYGQKIIRALPPARLIDTMVGNEDLVRAYLKGAQAAPVPAIAGPIRDRHFPAPPSDLDDEIPF